MAYVLCGFKDNVYNRLCVIRCESGKVQSDIREQTADYVERNSRRIKGWNFAVQSFTFFRAFKYLSTEYI
jgi:hypothetical protein